MTLKESQDLEDDRWKGVFHVKSAFIGAYQDSLSFEPLKPGNDCSSYEKSQMVSFASIKLFHWKPGIYKTKCDGVPG